jgi:hypothetical protein
MSCQFKLVVPKDQNRYPFNYSGIVNEGCLLQTNNLKNVSKSSKKVWNACNNE